MKELPSLRRVNGMYILVQLIYWSMFGAFSGFQTALLLGRGFSSGEAGVFAALRCLSGILAHGKFWKCWINVIYKQLDGKT